MEGLRRKYGLPTAIAMVVGVVIGSGVFFKADDVLVLTEGNLILALIAWGFGAFSMIFGALCFAEYAQRIEKSNGIVDYAEAAYGERMGFLVGWFKGVLYFSPLTAILAWVSALYTMILVGSDNPPNSGTTWVLSFVYLIVFYLINYYSAVISGKLQVTTTVIKLIPLSLISVVGVIFGLINGTSIENFAMAAGSVGRSSGTLASAVVATAFAYEGWIVALSINSEIKDSKKNLPKALTIGTLIVFLVYVMYFLGVASVLPTAEIISQGDNAVDTIARALFGNIAGTLLVAFVVISCLGTLNGLVMSNMRMPYALGIRGHGVMPKKMAMINKKTGMPPYATLFSAGLSLLYLGLWYTSINETFGRYIALDEMPIVMVYGIYIILYMWYIVNFKDLNIFSRFVKPICAILGAMVILYGGITNPHIGMNLLVSVAILLLGLFFYKPVKA